MLFDRGGKITPALRAPWVRQALNHALDRRTMLSALRLRTWWGGPETAGPTRDVPSRTGPSARHSPLRGQPKYERKGQ